MQRVWRNFRLQVLLGSVAILATCLNLAFGWLNQRAGIVSFAQALAALVGCFGWMRGLISLPMRKWRRMAGDFALLVICLLCFFLMRRCA